MSNPGAPAYQYSSKETARDPPQNSRGIVESQIPVAATELANTTDPDINRMVKITAIVDIVWSIILIIFVIVTLVKTEAFSVYFGGPLLVVWAGSILFSILTLIVKSKNWPFVGWIYCTGIRLTLEWLVGIAFFTFVGILFLINRNGSLVGYRKQKNSAGGYDDPDPVEEAYYSAHPSKKRRSQEALAFIADASPVVGIVAGVLLVVCTAMYGFFFSFMCTKCKAGRKVYQVKEGDAALYGLGSMPPIMGQSPYGGGGYPGGGGYMGQSPYGGFGANPYAQSPPPYSFAPPPQGQGQPTYSYATQPQAPQPA